jgi:hypothetical protein
MKFQSKPKVIEAYQVTRELLESVLLDGKEFPKGLWTSSASCNPKQRTISSWYGRVTTIHLQDIMVIEGDWIITETDGIHHYPCKTDIFVSTYEKVEDIQ